MPMIRFEDGIVAKHDAFFLDTNTIVSYSYKKDRYHEACKLFLNYLIFKDVKLYINDIVIAESINSLARVYYVDDEYQQFLQEHSCVAHSPEAKKKEIRRGWYDDVIKGDPVKLAKYNRLACRRVEFFIHACKLAPSKKLSLLQGMQHSYSLPLASFDALIVTAAESNQVTGIVSFDSDIHNATDIPVYRTFLDNDRFLPRARSIMHSLDPKLKAFLIGALGGPEFFEAQYPPSVRLVHSQKRS